jgi:tripartite-type tricarboxylate transporter receptor subunit TctC
MARSSVRHWLAVFTLLAFGAAAGAQEYPNRPVKLIVPFAAGTGADTTARFLAQQLSERLKQSFVVDNRPGAGAAVGVSALKRSAPDGYTIGQIVSANVVQPWLVKDPPFDIRKDFAPLAMMYSGPMVMTAGPSFTPRDVTEVIAYAKSNPGKVSVGSIGTGSATHLAAELLRQMAGIEIVNVPFKSAVEMHRAVASGDVSFSFDSYGSPRPLVEAGRLRVIAVTTKDRMSILPQVPSIGESFANFDMASWVALGAPLGTPQDILDTLTREIRAVMQTPEWRQMLSNNGVEPSLMTPAGLSQRIAGDYDKFGQIVKGAGIKPE